MVPVRYLLLFGNLLAISTIFLVAVYLVIIKFPVDAFHLSGRMKFLNDAMECADTNQLDWIDHTTNESSGEVRLINYGWIVKFRAACKLNSIVSCVTSRDVTWRMDGMFPKSGSIIDG
jgi:hypothetical protein